MNLVHFVCIVSFFFSQKKKVLKLNNTHIYIGVPYACKRMVHQSEQVSPQVFKEFEKLVREFKDYEQ